MSDPLDQLIAHVRNGRDLMRDQTAAAFTDLMAGRLPEEKTEAFLRALSAKGESIEEIVGAATVMRRHVTRIECDATDAIDTCGTGGDGISTFNVSTVAAIVAAAAGAVVAKHGNRSNSRKSGSAEVLTALGVNIDAPPETVSRCIREIGIGFCYAARLHPAMGHVAAVRHKIGKPTIFNLLGPLTNPAFVRRQIVGVPRTDLMPKIAGVLKQLGAVRALVVHGDDGLCDLTITAPSRVMALRDGNIQSYVVTPEDVGLQRGSLDDLRIDSPAQSADAIRAILAGERGPRRDHTLLNAAAALLAADVVQSLADGVARGADAIDTGRARAKLDRLAAITGGTA